MPWQNAQLSENPGTTMTKIIITAIIALASIGAHAQVTYKTSFDCAKASTYSEHAMCEDKALADADLAYWKVFQAARNAATDKQAFHNHAITAFKYRQQCADRECIVNWFKDQNAYIASLNTPAAGQTIAASTAPAAEQHWVSGSTAIVAHQTSNRTGYRIEFSFVPCSRLPETVPANVPRDPHGYVVFAYDHPGHSPNIGCGVVMSDQSGSVTAVNWADIAEQPYYISSDMQRGE